jgi:hypothetical protein
VGCFDAGICSISIYFHIGSSYPGCCVWWQDARSLRDRYNFAAAKSGVEVMFLPTELSKAFQQDIFYPPILFARDEDVAIAEQYVSSHPLSGLVLWSKEKSKQDKIGRASLKCDYEPNFPIALVGLQKHRLWSMESDWISKFDSMPPATRLLQWIEENG